MRLNGGEFLLDLTPIEVEESVDTETYTSITNVDVLKQLTNLKRYIANPSAIKPVWVKFVNSETDEIVVVKGELSKIIDSDEFDIYVKTKGYDLTIHVEFTQALNEDNDPIDDWYIDTNDAKYLFTSNVVSGGTKLYRHDISIETNNIVISIHAISVLSEPLTIDTQFNNTDFVSISYVDRNDQYIILASIINSDTRLELQGWVCEDSELFAVNALHTAIDSFEDTVTPL